MASHENGERAEYSATASRQLILKKLNRDSEIRITDLSKDLNTSVVTVRKDLDDLEREGLLKRVRGGAVLNYRGQNSVLQSDKMKIKKDEKMLIAAERQLNDIRFLKERGLLGSLPEGLKEMAEIRLENPELKLEDLGKLMDPPIGKSGVNHRLRRLTQLAEEERNK